MNKGVNIPLFQKAETGCDCDACILIRKRNKFYEQHYDCPIQEILSSNTKDEVIYLKCLRHNHIFNNFC